MAARSGTDRFLAAVALILGAATAARATPEAEVAAHTWNEVRTAHVTVVTDANRDVAQRVAQQLEDLRQVLSLAVPALVVESAPIEVLLFRDASLFATYAPTWHGLRDPVTGYFQTAPDVRRVLLADDPARLQAVAQHEYTHALLDAAMPEAPLWLSEGLAEYFSTFRAQSDEAEAGAPVRDHLDWLHEHDLMPLADLFATDPKSAAYHEGDRRGTFYAESWLLTHMLLSSGDDDLGRLEEVLLATRGGETFASAFARVFGDPGRLRERLVRYVDADRFAVHHWQLPSPLRNRPLEYRDRVPPAGVLAALGVALLARPAPQRELAADHLRQALVLDPRDPGACAGMGWLELQRGHRQTAREWFARSFERDPVDVPAVRLAAAQLLLDGSQRSSVTERQGVTTLVRAAIARAQAAAPGDPELEDLLARTYVVSPGDDPEPGWAHVERAAAGLPARPDVQLDRLALAALTGRADEAWQVFEAHFRHATRPELAHAARNALLVADVRFVNGLLKQGDVAGAIARISATRERLDDDPAIARDADRYLAELRTAEQSRRATVAQNRAIDLYNAGITASNAGRYREAAVAFRQAAAASHETGFRQRALRMATRMDLAHRRRVPQEQ